MWEIVKIVSAILAISFWLLSAFIWTRYNLSRPKLRFPEDGRIFPLDTHGSVVYLTAGEHYLLLSLIAVGVIFFLLAAVSYLIGGR
jgi:hypothetical protein